MLHYLAVHDLVWINNTVTGETLPFDYENLEACMAAQYGFGVSLDAAGQAANFLSTTLRLRPFAWGNVRTAFIATLTFLTANKFTMTAEDRQAGSVVRLVAEGSLSADEAVSQIFQQGELGLRPGVTLRTLVTFICNQHAEAIRQLTEGDQELK